MDGAHGGITPSGGIFAGVYNQRAPIPQVTIHGVEGDNVSEEIREERQSKEGIVREVEVGLVMDLATAESFYKWLGERISKIKEMTGKTVGSKT